MVKVGKTFTLDLQVLAWLEQYAKKEHKTASYIVNAMLNSAKRDQESWLCPECGVSNHIDNKSCFTLNDGEFCKGVKA